VYHDRFPIGKITDGVHFSVHATANENILLKTNVPEWNFAIWHLDITVPIYEMNWIPKAQQDTL
jgi:hypothetical protein